MYMRIMAALTLGFVVLPATADDGASSIDLLTVLERPLWSSRNAQRYEERALVAYDPATGKRKELLVSEEVSPPLGRYWTTSGGSLVGVDRQSPQSLFRISKHDRLEADLPEAVHREIRAGRHMVRVLELSPDGLGWVMLLGSSVLAMHRSGVTRTFAVDWIDWDAGSHVHEVAFAWSPDAEKVALYYAYSKDEGASLAVRDFGIAFVTLDDGMMEVVKPSGRRTPWLGVEALPPQWSSDSQYVYFVQGAEPSQKVPAGVYPVYAYRVNVRTGAEERLIQGQVSSVAPDDRYILLNLHFVKTETGEFEDRAAKLDLGTREVSLLPRGVHSPRVSPSGRYVAATYGKGVRFLDAADLSVINEVSSVSAVGSLEEWYLFGRWITLDAEVGKE
jgi:hypothetical protein